MLIFGHLRDFFACSDQFVPWASCWSQFLSFQDFYLKISSQVRQWMVFQGKWVHSLKLSKKYRFFDFDFDPSPSCQLRQYQSIEPTNLKTQINKLFDIPLGDSFKEHVRIDSEVPEWTVGPNWSETRIFRSREKQNLSTDRTVGWDTEKSELAHVHVIWP